MQYIFWCNDQISQTKLDRFKIKSHIMCQFILKIWQWHRRLTQTNSFTFYSESNYFNWKNNSSKNLTSFYIIYSQWTEVKNKRNHWLMYPVTQINNNRNAWQLFSHDILQVNRILWTHGVILLVWQASIYQSICWLHQAILLQFQNYLSHIKRCCFSN